MPINYSKYPANWLSEIRPRILKRAANKCEFCSIPNYAVGCRNEDGNFIPTSGNVHHDKAGNGELPLAEARKVVAHCKDVDYNNLIIIILTIAHLDHDVENHQVQDERLAALCQKCHLDYDRENNTNKRRVKRYKHSLFPEGYIVFPHFKYRSPD